MSQRQQLERLIEIDRRIRNGEYPNADKLASDLEVSRRVIFNDHEFMITRMGAPIEFDRKKGGWYYTDETWLLPSIIVTEGELLAFFLSIEVARRYLGTGVEETLRSAIQKITKPIKGSISIEMETLRTNYTFTTPTLLSENAQALLDLHHAIAVTQRVWMRYYTASRDDHTERIIHPYHLSNIRGDWYLVAFDELRNEFRNFLIGRIEEWKLLTEKFKRNPDFSIAQWMGTAFQTERGGEPDEVVIRFAPRAARYIRERRWHKTQQIEEQIDGGLILKFQTGGLGEVKRWVLQYGGDAEVLAPEELRQNCIEEISKLSDLYRL